MFGRIGRPRTAMRDYEAALLDLGGLRHVIEGMIAADRTNSEIATRLAEITGLRRVHPGTITNWVRDWQIEEREVQATR